MFFILNHENAVLAADEAFLESVGTTHIFLLAERFRFGDFRLDEENRTCLIGGKARTFTKRSIQTIFGGGSLYRIDEEELQEPSALNDPDVSLHEMPQKTPKTDTALLSTPNLPETAESEAEDLLGIFDAVDTPDAQGEEVPLPDWLSASDKPAAPKTVSKPSMPEATPEPTPFESDVPEAQEEDDLLDLLDFEEEAPADKPESDVSETQEEDDLLDLEEETLTTPDEAEEEEEEDFFGLLEVDESDETVAPTTQALATTPPLDDLIALKEEEETPDTDTPLFLKNTPSTTQPAVPTETYQIGDTPLADYQANAELIGITPDEYLGFLQQFTDESLQYKAGLESDNLNIFKKNLISIKDASQLLHLTQLSETLNNLKGSRSEEREELTSNFYGMIQHIRRDLDHNTQPAPQVESAPEPQAPPTPAAPSLSFDAAQPIPFDFSAKAASDELGLPEPLVQEFITDFVQQAKENISVFEEAQRTGNMETIQKTAHLLKGAASNLRIDPIAETLKSLQYNESSEAVPELFQTFLGQLKALVQFTQTKGAAQ